MGEREQLGGAARGETGAAPEEAAAAAHPLQGVHANPLLARAMYRRGLQRRAARDAGEAGAPVPGGEPAAQQQPPDGDEEFRLANPDGDGAGAVPGGAGGPDAEANFQSERLTSDPTLQHVLDGAATLGPGAHGLPVRKIQQALRDLGQTVGVDGNYGGGTTTAVRAFQQACGLPQSGTVDAATLTQLDARFASHQPHVALARGFDPAHPNAGTRALDAQDRAGIDQAINPSPRTATGAPPVFQDLVGGQHYADRLRALLDAEVTSQFQTIGRNGHGDADHAAAGATYQWSSIEQIADESKRVTDGVFGTYAQGPALRHATGQLRDRWEEQSTAISAMSPAQQRGIAEWRVQKILNEDNAVAQLNQQHGADLTQAPANGIAQGVRDAIAHARVPELVEIHKGWPGSAGNGQIQLQRFTRANPDANRRAFWRLFQTIIHEYIHTLTHADYSAYAQRLGDPRGHTLREGVTDAFTKTVWSTVEGSVTPALQRQVEGPFFDASQAPQVPPLSTYPQTAQAEQAMSLCGLRNMYAAYFNGRVDLIGGP